MSLSYLRVWSKLFVDIALLIIHRKLLRHKCIRLEYQNKNQNSIFACIKCISFRMHLTVNVGLGKSQRPSISVFTAVDKLYHSRTKSPSDLYSRLDFPESHSSSFLVPR